MQQDGLEEDRLGDAKYGSTRRGIAPVYGDKYLKKGIRMGDLLYPEAMKNGCAVLWNGKICLFMTDTKQIICPMMRLYAGWKPYGGRLKEYVCDLGVYLTEQIQNGKKRYV